MAVSRIAAAGRNASQPLVTITAMKRKFLSLLLALCAVAALRAGDSSSRPLIYTFPIREPIMPSVERLTAKCLAEAREMGADAVLIGETLMRAPDKAKLLEDMRRAAR